MIFGHDFFKIGICYPQKSLYTDKLYILYYIIFENGNDISFFNGLVHTCWRNSIKKIRNFRKNATNFRNRNIPNEIKFKIENRNQNRNSKSKFKIKIRNQIQNKNKNKNDKSQIENRNLHKIK